MKFDLNMFAFNLDFDKNLKDIGSVSPAFFVIFLCLVLRCSKRKVPMKGIPMVPNSHWILGHTRLLMLPDFDAAWRKLAYNHANSDGLCSFWVGSKPFISVTKAEHARAILNVGSFRDNSSHLTKHLSKIAGNKSLLLLMKKEWKTYRTIITRAFTPTSLDSMKAPMMNVVHKLVASLSAKCNEAVVKKEPLTMNMIHVFQMIIIDIFGITVFGKDFECCERLSPSPVASSLNFLISEFNRRLMSPLNPAAKYYEIPTSTNLRHKKEITFVRKYFSDLIREHEKNLHEYKGKESDLLSSLLLSVESHAKKEGMLLDPEETHEAMVDTVLTLYLGAFETAATTLTYILHCIVEHSDCESNFVHEAQRVLSNNQATVDPSEFTYCTAVMNEGWRLFPPFFYIRRTLEKSVKLTADITLPVKSDVLIPIWSIQRDERHYPRPLEFIPERWVRRSADGTLWQERQPREEEDKHNIDGTDSDIEAADRGAFIAFSAGGRSCVAEKMMRQQANVVLAVLLSEFQFKLAPGYKLQPISSGLAQKPKGGMPMIITKR